MGVTIIILVAIGLVLGILIYIVNVVVPQKVQGLERTEAIAGALPGANCGACGNPSCFAYARELSNDSGYLNKNPCGQALSDKEILKQLEAVLGIEIDVEGMAKKSLNRCNGNSDFIYDYSGVKTCKGAAQLLKGLKKCPYACLGFGDCAKVCPVDAITIDNDKNIAIIDKDTCIGCGLCEPECPQNVIDLIPVTTKVALVCNYQTLRDLPGREKCEFGCIHCRRCVKACEYDAIIFDTVRGIPIFDNEKCVLCGECVSVCPAHCLKVFTGTAKNAEPAHT